MNARLLRGFAAFALLLGIFTVIYPRSAGAFEYGGLQNSYGHYGE